MTASIRCLGENGIDGRLVHQVHVVERRVLAAELGHAAQRLLA